MPRLHGPHKACCGDLNRCLGHWYLPHHHSCRLEVLDVAVQSACVGRERYDERAPYCTARSSSRHFTRAAKLVPSMVPRAGGLRHCQTHPWEPPKRQRNQETKSGLKVTGMIQCQDPSMLGGKVSPQSVASVLIRHCVQQLPAAAQHRVTRRRYAWI